MNTFTFKAPSFNAHGCIEDAKRVVIIASEARDQGLHEALAIVRARVVKPSTCKSAGKVLSKSVQQRNKELEEIFDAIRELLSDDLPF